MPNGMYFSRLALLGARKTPAEIMLEKGMNIISGPSETGKSYILECLDYILGSKDQPKQIVEAQGYEKVRAEINFFDGGTITLSRAFNDNIIYMAECPFDLFDKEKRIALSIRHSQNTDNLSAYLLSKVGLAGKMLKENRFNGTNPLSFRDLAKLLLVREERIISARSPLFDSIVYTETENKALFKLLLTGEDDSSLPKFENPEFGKSRLKGKLELIQMDIELKTRELQNLKSRTSALNSDDINLQITKLISAIEGSYKDLEQQERIKEALWSEVNQLKTIVMHHEELCKRFDLLKAAYSSDLRRLEFINEGKFGLDQIKEVNCPLCNSLIDKSLLEPYPEEKDDFMLSIRAEYDKILTKKIDLDKTIANTSEELLESKKSLKLKLAQFEAVDKLIAGKLKPLHQINSENLQNFLRLKDDLSRQATIETQISDLVLLADHYNALLDQRLYPAPETKVPVNNYVSFCKNVGELLLSWNLPCDGLYFSSTTSDLTIKGSNRSTFGKGYRALYFSAFMLGLLQYCVRNRMNHPRFLALDSPLVTYKERDFETHLEAAERVPEIVQDRFYDGISKLDYIQRVQIIIIENRQPQEDVRKRVKSIHFTKNNTGRYGFIPVGNEL